MGLPSMLEGDTGNLGRATHVALSSHTLPLSINRCCMLFGANTSHLGGPPPGQDGAIMVRSTLGTVGRVFWGQDKVGGIAYNAMNNHWQGVAHPLLPPPNKQSRDGQSLFLEEELSTSPFLPSIPHNISQQRPQV